MHALCVRAENENCKVFCFKRFYSFHLIFFPTNLIRCFLSVCVCVCVNFENKRRQIEIEKGEICSKTGKLRKWFAEIWMCVCVFTFIDINNDIGSWCEMLLHDIAVSRKYWPNSKKQKKSIEWPAFTFLSLSPSLSFYPALTQSLGMCVCVCHCSWILISFFFC